MIKASFKSIYTKFIAIFFIILIISNIAAPLTIYKALTSGAYNSITENLKNTAYVIKNLVENKHITLDEIPKYIDNTNTISIYDNYEDINVDFSPSKLSTLLSGEPIFIGISDQEHFFTSIVQIQNKYVAISPNVNNNPLLKLRGIELKITLIPLIIGSILIAAAVATVVAPIKRISNASKEVANGNFDFEIKVTGNDEIAELTKNFNLMIKELSKNEYLHKNFVNSVSHEFKTPISSLRGYAKLLKEDNLTKEERNQYADVIISASERLSNLSTNLLRLAELENGNFVIKNVNFSLSEQIRSCIILMQNQWEEKDLELNLDIDEVNYTGDEELLYSVWFNLISNAIKYSEKGGILSVSVKQLDRIIVSVSDNGIGISKENLDNIFLKFFKEDKSRNSKGTGLGLSIAKKIIEFHNGKVLVESTLGVGSTFTVIL